MTGMKSSEFFKITVHFNFAAELNAYTGSSIDVANNQVPMETGYYYTFSAYDDNILNTVWLIATPHNQKTYDPDILFTYQIERESVST